MLQTNSFNWSILFFLLLYVFVPQKFGGFYFILFSIVVYAAVYLFHKSTNTINFKGLFIYPSSLLFLMAAITLSVTVTLSLNAAFFSTIGLSEIVKPGIFLLFFAFAAISNLQYSASDIKRTLVLASKIIIAGQFVIVTDQAFGIDAFTLIYDYGKESSTEETFSFLRSTGSLLNPNYFAWIILQCGVAIFLFSNTTSRYFWLLLVLLMILLSGSKSILASFPLALLAAGWLKGNRVIVNRKNLYILLSIVIVVFAVYQFLIIYPDIFPRLKVLFLLLSGEDESGGGRYAIWEKAYAYFLLKEEGVTSWLFGMGPIQMFKTLDNGFLYMLFRNGIIGLILHLVLLIYFLVMFFRFEDRELGALGFQYVFLGALSELVGESLAGWMVPIHLFLLAGIAFSYQYRYELAAREANVRTNSSIQIA